MVSKRRDEMQGNELLWEQIDADWCELCWTGMGRDKSRRGHDQIFPHKIRSDAMLCYETRCDAVL